MVAERNNAKKRKRKPERKMKRERERERESVGGANNDRPPLIGPTDYRVFRNIRTRTVSSRPFILKKFKSKKKNKEADRLYIDWFDVSIRIVDVASLLSV